MTNENLVIALENINLNDIDKVGGKNASLGEMIQHLTKAGVQVPQGFATTAHAFRLFLEQGELAQKMQALLANLDVNNIPALTQAGKQIREWIMATPLLPELEYAVKEAYQQLQAKIQNGFTANGVHQAWQKQTQTGIAAAANISTVQTQNSITVAVRSSATAEDLPDTSFAGQQETFLNISGLDNILLAIKRVYASLYTDRAISYRAHHGFEHDKVALSVGVQQMVRSDKASSGIAFTIDTESGFEDVIFITSAYGLGEPIVQGAVNPDEFYVYKPNLIANRPAIIRRNLGSKAIKMINADTQQNRRVEQNKNDQNNHRNENRNAQNNYADQAHHTETNNHHAQHVVTISVPENERQLFSLTDDEIYFLAKQALFIEQHYKRPMDIEWAKDGIDGKIYIVQARPETVKSRKNTNQSAEHFQLKKSGIIKTTGRSIGQRIGKGIARVITDLKEMDRIQKGDVLVADMTDPDWEPIMKRAAAIITNRGGRTCHAAIIARELGIPAIVGCGDATRKIKEGEAVTVSCAQGETGYVYEGLLDYDIQYTDLSNIPKLPFKIMLNIGNPEHAFNMRSIPNEGVGLARLEFLISQSIGIHPKALLHFNTLSAELQTLIKSKTACYNSPVDFYVEKLTEGIATLAAAFYPKKVIVRFSDFKSNEYANLIGGQQFEPEEENPMLGFRGASRYANDLFSDCFALECQAIHKVRDEMGLTNIEVMIPFVRTVAEAQQVINVLAKQGLRRGENGLRIIMMCEIPSNALLAEQFLELFDGFSIGSNDLTQLTLGLDRDSAIIAQQFDERNLAVKALLKLAINACKKMHKYIGICGQGPSDHPDFAQWLMEEGIETVSLNPDSVISTLLYLTKQ